jgi:hypothetical protein
MPWRTILMHAPTIVDAARSFYGGGKTDDGLGEGTTRRLDGVRARMASLEEREMQQAALYADLARQLQDTAAALEALRGRVQVAIVGTSIALVVSVLAAALALWR